MTEPGQASKIIKENELKALFFMKYCQIDNAEKILLDNIKKYAQSTLTYDLLIKIYEEKKDFHSQIKILNEAIKNTSKSSFYRKLKKQVIISKIFSDIFKKWILYPSVFVLTAVFCCRLIWAILPLFF